MDDSRVNRFVDCQNRSWPCDIHKAAVLHPPPTLVFFLLSIQSRLVDILYFTL